MNETTDKSWRVHRREFLKFAAFTGAGITLGKYLRDYHVRAAAQRFVAAGVLVRAGPVVLAGDAISHGMTVPP